MEWIDECVRLARYKTDVFDGGAAFSGMCLETGQALALQVPEIPDNARKAEIIICVLMIVTIVFF